MPRLGFGTATFPFEPSEVTKKTILQAIEIGYRHFDTTYLYGTKQPLGEAIIETVSVGLTESRDDLIITSKLWCSDAHGELVLPALQGSLLNLKLEYLDLFLIHWPISATPGTYEFPIKEEDFIPMDFNAVWAGMEECQRLGLTKSIGVSNFSCKKLADILTFAKIPPTVNQVEMNQLWQQKKVREFCNEKWDPFDRLLSIGSQRDPWGTNRVMKNEVLNQIAKAKGKKLAQICIRWVYEQEVIVLVKSFNSERMKQNLEIFDWSLSEEELEMINALPQSRGCDPFNTIDDFWDGEI